MTNWEKHETALKELWENNAGNLTVDMVMGYLYEQGILASQLEPLGYTTALKDIFSLIDDNILIRNIADDGDIMKFMEQGIRLTNTLANAKKLADASYNFGGHFSSTQIEVIEKQVENWDLTKTVTKAVEELNELSVELLHSLRGKPSNPLEEIADCFIALQHLEIKFGYCQNFINKKVGKGEPKL